LVWCYGGTILGLMMRAKQAAVFANLQKAISEKIISSAPETIAVAELRTLIFHPIYPVAA